MPKPAAAIALLLLLAPLAAPAQVRIRDLPADSSPADTDAIPVAKAGGSTMKQTRAQLTGNLCPIARTIATAAPLAGGGNLSANLSLSIANATGAAVGVLQITGDLSGTATSPQVVDDSHNHTGSTISGLNGADMTSAIGGRSLTLNSTAIDADAELYTRTACMTIQSPVGGDNILWLRTNLAWTATRIDCLVNAATNAVINVQVCNANGGSCSNLHSSNLTCTTSNTAQAPPSTTAISSGIWLRVNVASVSGTPGMVSVCLTYTVDD